MPHQRLCPLRRRQPDRHVHRERRLSEAAAEGLPQPQSECVPEPRPDARPGIRAPNIGTTRILPLPGEAGLSLACSPPPPAPLTDSGLWVLRRAAGSQDGHQGAVPPATLGHRLDPAQIPGHYGWRFRGPFLSRRGQSAAGGACRQDIAQEGRVGRVSLWGAGLRAACLGRKDTHPRKGQLETIGLFLLGLHPGPWLSY